MRCFNVFLNINRVVEDCIFLQVLQIPEILGKTLNIFTQLYLSLVCVSQSFLFELLSRLAIASVSAIKFLFEFQTHIE